MEYVGRYHSEKVGDDLILAPQFADVFGVHQSLISARFTRGPNERVTGFLAKHKPSEGFSPQEALAGSPVPVVNDHFLIQLRLKPPTD